MTIYFLWLVLSLIILSFGADFLVRGAGAIALRVGITPLVVGLTIVAFGTSAPELVVSVNASFKDQGAMAIGNIVGSNIFNIAVILGMAALVSPLVVKPQLVKFDTPLCIFVTILFSAMFHDQFMSRIEGGILFSGLIAYTVYSVISSRKETAKAKAEAEALGEELPKPSNNPVRDMGFIALGGLGLWYGGEMLVKNAVLIAQGFGVSEAIIGLTIVSAGTSAPELATSVVASFQKQTDIAVGNIVGSNLFNILSVVGLASLINPISAVGINLSDILVMNGLTILLLVLMIRGYRLFRGEGFLLLFIYVGYLYYLWPK